MTSPVFLTGDQVPDYLRGVELMTAGIEWQASTGPVTITLEHIADAITACNEDPHIQPPRIKLGHTSPVNGDHPDHDPFAAIGDAEPAFGIFSNLKATNDGAVLTGDADRILTWLALAAPAAYPNRSAEATWQVADAAFDVQTAGGKRYSMVVTAVSLLGVYAPAISDLEDLKTLIMDGPAALASQTSGETAQTTVAAASADASMSVSWDTIWERSLDWLRENKPEWPYAWTRDVRVDPSECIVDDDQGHLWALPFSTDGGNTITYGPALTPKAPPQFPDAPMPVMAGRLVASFARPSKSERPVVAAGSTIAATERPNTEGAEHMDESVRQFLVGQGHDPDTASETQIQAAEAYVKAFPTTDPPDPPAAPVTGGDAVVANDDKGDAPAVIEPTGTDDPTPVDTDRVPIAAARPVPEGAVVIDAEELARLRAGAEAGTRLAAEQARKERDTTLFTARDEGRFPPARLEHYRRMWDTDPEGTRTLLTADETAGGLAKGTVPLGPKGETPDPTGAGADGLTAADRTLLAASRSRMGHPTTQEA